jgi:signal transduction histidine kinase
VLPRFLTSVSAKLLAIILVAGAGINLAIFFFIGAFQFHAAGAFSAHLMRYVNYLVADLGSPPDLERARQMARSTPMIITFESPAAHWATGNIPASFVPQRLRYEGGRIQIYSSHGNHAVFVNQPGGRIGFYLFQPKDVEKKIKHLGFLLLLFISLLMLAAFLAIRWVLRPLNWLKGGVDQLGRGNLAHRVPLKRRDELRDLSQAFNSMAERLGRLIQAKEQLLLDVSHELRTPITRIKVALAMLPEEDDKQGILDDLNEIEAKITELLETARSLGIKAQLNRSPVDLGALIRQVAGPYQDLPPGVVLRPTDRHQPVMVDREQMTKVLRNVIDNAVKYSLPESKSIEIGLDFQSDKVFITIRDYGMGIPAEDLEFVFEPFYRVDKAHSPNAGYGLGLSLVKTIVEAHNGRVELESTLAKGTVVNISLPLA